MRHQKPSRLLQAGCRKGPGYTGLLWVWGALLKEKTTDFNQKVGIFLSFFYFQHTPPNVFMKILTKQPPWKLFVCHKKVFFKPKMPGCGESGHRCSCRAGHPTVLRARCCPGSRWQTWGSGARGCLRNQRVPNLLSGRRSEATRSLRRSPALLVSPGPWTGSEPGSPGTPHGIASCLQAAPEGQPGLGSAVSQPLRLPLIHFTLSILIGSALSPAPPPSHALPPAGCCTTGQPGLHAA